MPVADFVLSAPKKEQAEELAAAVDQGAKAVFSLIDNGLEKTQQAFN